MGTEAELSSLDEQGGLWCLLLVDLALATASAGVLTSAPLRLTMSTRGQARVMAAEGGVQCSSLYKPDIATQSAKMSRAASDGGLRTRRWATVPSEARTPSAPVWREEVIATAPARIAEPQGNMCQLPDRLVQPSAGHQARTPPACPSNPEHSIAQAVLRLGTGLQARTPQAWASRV